MKRVFIFLVIVATAATAATAAICCSCNNSTVSTLEAAPAPKKGKVVGVLQTNALYSSGHQAGTISVSYMLLESGEIIRTEPTTEFIRPYIHYPYTNEEARIIIQAMNSKTVPITYY